MRKQTLPNLIVHSWNELLVPLFSSRNAFMCQARRFCTDDLNISECKVSKNPNQQVNLRASCFRKAIRYAIEGRAAPDLPNDIRGSPMTISGWTLRGKGFLRWMCVDHLPEPFQVLT